jgi:hypothetical protein
MTHGVIYFGRISIFVYLMTQRNTWGVDGRLSRPQAAALLHNKTLIEEVAAWFFLYARFNGTTAARTLDNQLLHRLKCLNQLASSLSPSGVSWLALGTLLMFLSAPIFTSRSVGLGSLCAGFSMPAIKAVIIGKHGPRPTTGDTLSLVF